MTIENGTQMDADKRRWTQIGLIDSFDLDMKAEKSVLISEISVYLC